MDENSDIEKNLIVRIFIWCQGYAPNFVRRCAFLRRPQGYAP